MNNTYFIKNSIEINLFFLRIMKEHSLFLEASFTEKDKRYKEVARNFGHAFAELLNRTITIANGNVTKEFLNNYEIVTKDTLKAEEITSKLSGIPIDIELTQKELNLIEGPIENSPYLSNSIENINREILSTVRNLIEFKEDILKNFLECKMYTTNYPLLINHILLEAKLFHDIILKLQNKEHFDDHFLHKEELFWNNIMMEHTQFIRGLLDPTEKELMLKASKFTEDYDRILREYRDKPHELTMVSLRETEQLKEFKQAGLDGLLTCNIKSIIVPLLADHVLREANHFIRILKNMKS